MVEEMQNRNPGINIEFYIDPHVLAAIYSAQGLDPPMASNEEDNDEEEEGEEEGESGEEIIEEFEPEP